MAASEGAGPTWRTAFGSGTARYARSTARNSPRTRSAKATRRPRARSSPSRTPTRRRCRCPRPSSIEIVAFVDRDSIDPIRLGEGNHYLRADGQVAAKPYVLLRKALERTDKVAIAKFALRGRERLGMLRIKGDALLLNGMHWDEIPDGKAPRAGAPGRARAA
ncbi:Ku protein [Streptomyces sp. NPDC056470]|uniref:Ku protein n=1 Tax=Streptomyces sp. NPDC056470 TaxID=3345831 RepID=UPI0036749FF1